MTIKELKQIIANVPEQEWFKNISITFYFSFNQNINLTGLSAIYEFVNQQIDGWNKYDELPSELKQSISYFNNIRNAIIGFVNSYSQDNQNTLKAYWQNNVIKYLNTDISPKPLLYNTPEVEFLIKLYKEKRTYYNGAYDYLLKTNNNNYNNSDFLSGAILAYEFIFKDSTEITKRREAEQSSISKLRSDFQKYISVSEEQLATHLNNANNNYENYVKKIDDLKTEKEDLFNTWFEDTKKNKWQNWYEPSVKKITELENTYKEKLKLEEPAKYWAERANKLKRQGKFSLGILICLVILICIFLGLILWNPPEIFRTSILSNDKSTAIKWILIYATLLSFLAYTVRALSKIMFSSFHLARDCEERHTLTYFYLSLLKDSKVNDNDRQLIMQSLFSRADTGLLKEDSSPTMPSELISKIMYK